MVTIGKGLAALFFVTRTESIPMNASLAEVPSIPQTQRSYTMSNVHPIYDTRDLSEIDREAERQPGAKRNPTTTLQLKRQAAFLRRAIRKEEKRQEAQRLVLILQRKLSDTVLAGSDLPSYL